MPSRVSGEATEVARTTVSPIVQRAAPEACLAIRPVSKTSRLPPASSTATSVFVDIESSFRFSLGKLGKGRRGRDRQRHGEKNYPLLSSAVGVPNGCAEKCDASPRTA